MAVCGARAAVEGADYWRFGRGGSGFGNLPTRRVAQLALQYRIPAICALRSFADEGGLMSYWFTAVDLYHRAAIIVDKVLKGAKPADIPIEQPTKFEVVLNLKTASELGIEVPTAILLRADKLIE
jgi:putative ABC transport system substrate-binding protein